MLSPSTSAKDRGLKLAQYKGIASVRMVVLIEGATQRIDVYERAGESGWREFTLGAGEALMLGAIGTELTAEELFRRV